MARIATDQSTVLQAVVDRLIAQIESLTAKNCFLTASPPQELPANVRDNAVVTVSPTNGRFDDPVHEGGGINTTFENAGVLVVIFSAIKLDRVGHDLALLRDASRGLLILKHEILKALSGHDLQDANGDGLLINLMAPVTTDAPRSIWERNPRRTVADIALTFSTDFEWSLS